jgi:hypothetical protein
MSALSSSVATLSLIDISIVRMLGEEYSISSNPHLAQSFTTLISTLKTFHPQSFEPPFVSSEDAATLISRFRELKIEQQRAASSGSVLSVTALRDLGIENVLQHPSLPSHDISTLLDNCDTETRRKMLPELLAFLKACCVDVLKGKPLRTNTYHALPRIFMSISHGFGCSSCAAIDTIFRHIAPLANEQRSQGNVIRQLIVPRF